MAAFARTRRWVIHRRRGAAAVEFALILPFLFLLFAGLWEVGRLVEVHQILSRSLAAGGRAASTGVYTTLQVRQAVLDSLQLAGLPSSRATVTVTNLTHPSSDVIEAERLDSIQLTVQIAYSDVSWINTNLVLGNSFPIQRQAVWYSARGLDYPTNIVVPPGE